MARKESATLRYRRLLKQAIRRREKKGQTFGTLKADIKQMNWRELKKLITPSKTGKGTYKGLEEYQRQYQKELDEEFDEEKWYDTRDYERAEDTPTYDQDSVDFVYYVIERLSIDVPKFGTTIKGDTFKRKPEAIKWSEEHRNALINLIYRVGGEDTLEALGDRLRKHATEVEECIDRVLLAYTEENASYARLAEIITGGYNNETAKLVGEIENYEEPV